jgi:hypothetical protein
MALDLHCLFFSPFFIKETQIFCENSSSYLVYAVAAKVGEGALTDGLSYETTAIGVGYTISTFFITTYHDYQLAYLSS